MRAASPLSPGGRLSFPHFPPSSSFTCPQSPRPPYFLPPISAHWASLPPGPSWPPDSNLGREDFSGDDHKRTQREGGSRVGCFSGVFRAAAWLVGGIAPITGSRFTLLASTAEEEPRQKPQARAVGNACFLPDASLCPPSSGHPSPHRHI